MYKILKSLNIFKKAIGWKEQSLFTNLATLKKSLILYKQVVLHYDQLLTK